MLANRDARQAMASHEVISLDQLALLIAGCPLTANLGPEELEKVRAALAGVEPAEEHYELYWAVDAYDALQPVFGDPWWPRRPEPPLHRLVMDAIRAVDSGGWTMDVTPRVVRYRREDDGLELELELALPMGA